MRFETKSIKIAEQGLTDLLCGKRICQSQRLNLLRCYALAAKKQGDFREWHQLLNIIKNYENITDIDQVDRILVKLSTKLDFMDEKTDNLD